MALYEVMAHVVMARSRFEVAHPVATALRALVCAAQLLRACQPGPPRIAHARSIDASAVAGTLLPHLYSYGLHTYGLYT